MGSRAPGWLPAHREPLWGLELAVRRTETPIIGTEAHKSLSQLPHTGSASHLSPGSLVLAGASVDANVILQKQGELLNLL